MIRPKHLIVIALSGLILLIIEFPFAYLWIVVLVIEISKFFINICLLPINIILPWKFFLPEILDMVKVTEFLFEKIIDIGKEDDWKFSWGIKSAMFFYKNVFSYGQSGFILFGIWLITLLGFILTILFVIKKKNI